MKSLTLHDFYKFFSLNQLDLVSVFSSQSSILIIVPVLSNAFPYL